MASEKIHSATNPELLFRDFSVKTAIPVTGRPSSKSGRPSRTRIASVFNAINAFSGFQPSVLVPRLLATGTMANPHYARSLRPTSPTQPDVALLLTRRSESPFVRSLAAILPSRADGSTTCRHSKRSRGKNTLAREATPPRSTTATRRERNCLALFVGN